MAASGYTPISLYYSTTAAAAPVAGNLVNGELAINITDGKLYYKDNTGTVKVIAGTGGTGVVAGSNTQIQFNNSGVFGASSGLTWASSTLTASNITTAGSLTLSGGTANGVAYLNGSKVVTAGSTLTFDGTNLGIANINGATTLTLKTGGTAAVTISATQKMGVGTATPLATLHVVGGNSNNAIIDNGGQQYTTLSWYNNGTEKAQTYWDQTNGLFVSGTDVSAAYVFKTNGTERMRIGGSTGNVSIGTASTPIKFLVNATDAIGIPVGTTAERPTGAEGYIRVNTDYDQFEGYVNGQWSQIGGGATGGGGDQVFVENSMIVTTSYTFPSGKNASSVGPITINSGATVTIPDGQRWVIL